MTVTMNGKRLGHGHDHRQLGTFVQITVIFKAYSWSFVLCTSFQTVSVQIWLGTNRERVFGNVPDSSSWTAWTFQTVLILALKRLQTFENAHDSNAEHLGTFEMEHLEPYSGRSSRCRPSYYQTKYQLYLIDNISTVHSISYSLTLKLLVFHYNKYEIILSLNLIITNLLAK